MILRNREGHIVFASCRFLEAEVSACAEGIALALEWSTLPFIVEIDYYVAAQMLMDDTPNRSSVAALIEKGKLLLKSGRDYSIAHVRRSQNNVAHALAQMGRSSTRWQFGSAMAQTKLSLFAKRIVMNHLD